MKHHLFFLWILGFCATVVAQHIEMETSDALPLGAFQYTGETLSLNFQNIEVRAVLQQIADVTGLNLVASDSIVGNITLHLQDVPWDQALDLILHMRGLDKKQEGNVLFIAPREEMAAREKANLQAEKQVQELSPLSTEMIQVNYANAQDLATLLKDKTNSLLSARGAVSVDVRTNTLLIQDTPEKLIEIRNLIQPLDVPIQQVLIESRIVLAADNFEKAFGVYWGAAGQGRLPSPSPVGFKSHGEGEEGQALQSHALHVFFPANFSDPTPAGRFGLEVARLGKGTLLDLELDALESEGLMSIVSTPRLITSNQTPAYIESGEEIPYIEATKGKVAHITFKKAVLKLAVTPQVTPDKKIALDLTVNQDNKGEEIAAGLFTIDTRVLKTKVLVDNGETIVLGGIYRQDKHNKVQRVPFLGRLPLLGWLFRNEHVEDDRTELIIFVTPKIIESQNTTF